MKIVARKPQTFTVDECFSPATNLPEKLELIDGEIGPFSDAAKMAILANWGSDKIVVLTGPDVWGEEIAALLAELSPPHNRHPRAGGDPVDGPQHR